MYTDLSLMTADPRIGQDAAEFFKNMSIGNLDGEYRHLLVAPVFAAGAQERSVYLPKGDAWREVATGKTYEGGQTVTAKAPIDVIPLFVRVGADLPL